MPNWNFKQAKNEQLTSVVSFKDLNWTKIYLKTLVKYLWNITL